MITNFTLLNLAEILHDELGGEGVHPLPHHALLSYDSTKDNHEDQHAAKSQVKDWQPPCSQKYLSLFLAAIIVFIGPIVLVLAHDTV